jgi:hypothetical protein
MKRANISKTRPLGRLQNHMKIHRPGRLEDVQRWQQKRGTFRKTLNLNDIMVRFHQLMIFISLIIKLYYHGDMVILYDIITMTK